jgi:hypothetical protein
MVTMSRVVVSLALVGSLAVGCGGSPPPQAAVKPVAAAPAAQELGIHVTVEPSSDDATPLVPSVTSSLTTALSTAGYRLIEDAAKADVHAKVKLNATPEASVFQVQVNGKNRVTYKVELAASFLGAAESAVVDSTTAEFSSSEGSIDASAIDRIVAHVGTTGKLAAYAGKLKAKDAQAAASVQQQEDDLWKAANADGCRAADTDKACDGVKAYVAKYPAGKFTADARKAMTDGDVHLAGAAEEKMWTAAASDQCVKPTKSYDCKGVEEYLAKYPSGVHAADAKAAMKASEKPREALLKKEEANKKKASYDDCVKSCRRDYADYRPAAFEILVARCVQTECR